MIKHERDICVVKCAASLRRKRSVFEENGHLTTQMSQEQLRQQFGETEGSPKPLLDRKPNKRTAQHELRLSTLTDAQLLLRVPLHRLYRTTAHAPLPPKAVKRA
ncbi:hypothetical protein AEM38_11475 [Hyphomonadaceae bacterium UKL13-1]|nr:hypothetical protein AEM38_11475 [Hyphomonadaceae bacterium UKL13-1]